MATLQAGHVISVRLPNYKSGLHFLVQHVKVDRYVRDLKGANKHIAFTRREARACWLRTLELEYKELIDKSTDKNGELNEGSMLLYQKGVEQVGTAQWLMELEQDSAPVAESDGAGRMLNHLTNAAGEVANLSERMNDLITSIPKGSGTIEDSYYTCNSKQLSSKQLKGQIARRERQEESRYVETANEMLEILAAKFYQSGLQDLEAQWLGPVPPEAVEKYKKACMGRARALFKEQAKPGAKMERRTALEMSMDIDSGVVRDEVELASGDDVWEDKDQMSELKDFSNINLQKPFMDANQPIDPTMESIERAVLEMHRLRYVGESQQLKGSRSWHSGLLNFARVREVVRFKMQADLDQQVSKAKAGAELNKIMNEQAKVFKMMRNNYEPCSKETSVEPTVKEVTKKQRKGIERMKRSKQRREVKLQKRQGRERNLSASGANESPHHASTSRVHCGTRNLLLPTAGADIGMDTALKDETDFELPIHKPAFLALRSSSGYNLRRNARPTPPSPEERKQEDDEGISRVAKFELHMGIDRMVLQD